MPRDNQKRGRREQKKRRLDQDDEDDTERVVKRQRSIDDGHDESSYAPAQDVETPFFGLLDEQEQEYFKRAGDLLELDQFEGPEERSLFLANVYKEADGKELRLACSQSCSRLLERLILLSNAKQLKNLFQKFSGNVLHLVQHRFASHCCERLFIQAAPFVSQELTAGGPQDDGNDPNAIIESMENLFLHTINELEGHIGYLMTDRFASHTLRILLVILSGNSLEQSSRKNALQSKKKERIVVAGNEKAAELALQSRTVPDSFHTALEKLIHDCVSNLDTTNLRALTTHPIGNPVLQLLLQTELKWYGKQRAKDEASLLHKLIPDDFIAADSESAIFINNLVYDTVGSRLLEVIIQSAPGKLFKTLYKQFFRERLPSLARNEIAGYVVCKILERLGKEDLQEAMQSILPHMNGLVERSRTTVIKGLVDSCAARGVATTALAKALETAYAGSGGFEIACLLKTGDAPIVPDSSSIPGEPTPPSSNPEKIDTRTVTSSEKLHGSLLAQSMLVVSGPLSELIYEGLNKTDAAYMLKLARDPAGSRVIQAALTSPNATTILRKRLIQNFYGETGAMALDSSASRVIDAIWEGTGGLAFIRERIAEELAENEASLRESNVGRHVWRRWDMDLWKRRRTEWVRRCRESVGADGFPSWPEDSPMSGQQHGEGGPVQSAGHKKTALELARERHAAKKANELKQKAKDGSAQSHQGQHLKRSETAS